MRVPGIVYSLLLAAAAYLIEYFTVGVGSGVPWSTVALAAIPVILKFFTVTTGPEEPNGVPSGPTSAQARGMGDAPVAAPSKMERFLLG